MADTSKKLPNTDYLKLLVVFFPRYHLMSTCWQEEPMLRPEFLHIRNKLREFIENEVMKTCNSVKKMAKWLSDNDRNSDIR